MVSEKDIVNIHLTKLEIMDCIKKTVSVQFLDNLRHRHPNIQFDCKLRGYVGELAIKKWFEANDIKITATDYLEDGDSIDIDFIISEKNIELKTSLIPDGDITMQEVINNRDIKLIRRGEQKIEDLRGDIHMQVYYNQRTKAKDNWLREQQIDLSIKDYEYLYNSFLAKAYLNTTFFVAWIDKPTLVNYINQLPNNQRCWSFKGSQRFFWKCPIKYSRQPIELIEYLKKMP